MRIDLCADMVGILIQWFLSRLRVKFKRVAHEIGQLKAQRISKLGVQTISAGKRPNMLRAYDKVAECTEQLRKLQRKRSRDADELSLETEFGIVKGSVMTRIERQFGGNRIPFEIDCFSKLGRPPEFTPCTNVEIWNGTGAHVPTIEECGLDTWLSGTRLSELQEEIGYQQFNRWLNGISNGNSARYKKSYLPFLQPGGNPLVTTETIFETYQASIIKRLSA
jgi:hypothetical protein